MRALLRKWQILIRRFQRSRTGAAAVEFALILPFMLTLYVGSVEASSLFTVDRRVSVISASVADLVSRWDQSTKGNMPSATLTDYFKAAAGIMIPYSTTGLKQVISSVKVDASGNGKVVWSIGYNGAAARAANSNYAISSAQVKSLAAGGTVIVAEAGYSYKPVLGIVFTTPVNLYSESVYFPRFLTEIVKPGT